MEISKQEPVKELWVYSFAKYLVVDSSTYNHMLLESLSYPPSFSHAKDGD